jgi:hypothetical protein
MHLFGDKIKQAIFIAATMLPFGFQTEQDIKDVIQKNFHHAFLSQLCSSIPLMSGNKKWKHACPKTLIENEQGAPDLSEFGDVYDLNFGLGEDHPPTSMVLRKEFQRTILYQQSSQEVCIICCMVNE